MRRRVLILVNRAAHGPAERLARAVAARLAGRAELAFPESAAAATALAREARDAFEVIAAAGGDGAASAAAAGLVGAATPLALLPAGAANVLAGELAAPRHPTTLARMLMTGAPTPRALGFASGVPFLTFAGVGLDARAAEAVRPVAKRLIGPAAYVLAIAEAALRPASALTVTIDGETEKAAWAIAGDGRLWPGAAARAPEGFMRLVTLPRLDAAALAAIVTGRLAAAPHARVRAFRRALIAADPPCAAQADGAWIGPTPLSIDVAPRPVFVLTPAAAA